MNVVIFQNKDGSQGVAAFPQGNPTIVRGAPRSFIAKRSDLPNTPPDSWVVDFDNETISQGKIVVPVVVESRERRAIREIAKNYTTARQADIFNILDGE